MFITRSTTKTHPLPMKNRHVTQEAAQVEATDSFHLLQTKPEFVKWLDLLCFPLRETKDNITQAMDFHNEKAFWK